jgi:predicted TPR repeat methyltransferase
VFDQFKYNNPTLVQTEQALSEKRFSDAAALLNALQRQNTDDPRIYYLGSALGFATGNHERALQAIDRALEMAPGWPRAMLLRANALSQLKRDKEALAECRAIIEDEPTLVDAAYLSTTVGARLGDRETPEKLLLSAHQANPKSVEIWYNLAVFFASHKEHLRTLHWTAQILKAHPMHAASHLINALTYQETGDIERAKRHIDIARQVSPEDETIEFEWRKLRGETPSRVPTSAVTNLFNVYAPTFDSHLVGALGYRIPKIVAERIRATYPDLRINVLDLGCGTGLLGAYLGPIQGYLVGVDLSTAMIEKARTLGVYQRFHTVDVNDALEATDAEEYEVIVANDVLCYIGDPKRTIHGAYNVLRQGGAFYFTCERADNDEADFVLQSTERFTHAKKAIERECLSAGFANVAIEEMSLRSEAGEDVLGFLVTAQKSA